VAANYLAPLRFLDGARFGGGGGGGGMTFNANASHLADDQQ